MKAHYLGNRKDPAVATLLAIFSGWVGGHHFYFGRYLLGLAYLLLFWTFVPLVLSLVEAFFQPMLTRRWNVSLVERLVRTFSVTGVGTG